MIKRILKSSFDFGIALHAPLLQLPKRRLVVLYHDLHAGETTESGHPVNLGMSVSITDFEEQLRWMSTFADLVSMDDLMAADERSSDRWKIAVTFDDAYRNVFRLGLPVLEKLQVPAMVFVPVWYIEDTRRLPWWDLADVARYQWKGPLSVTLAGTPYTFDMDQESGKEMLQGTLEKICYHASRDQLLDVQNSLTKALAEQVPIVRNHFVSKEELQAGAESSLISIASHGSCHYNAAKDTPEQFQKDVDISLKLLREWTMQSIDYYSYPYGKGAFRSQETADVLDSFELKAAFSNDPGYLTVETDPMLVPRLSVIGHWGMRSFKSRVLAINMRNALQGAGE